MNTGIRKGARALKIISQPIRINLEEVIPFSSITNPSTIQNMEKKNNDVQLNSKNIQANGKNGKHKCNENELTAKR